MKLLQIFVVLLCIALAGTAANVNLPPVPLDDGHLVPLRQKAFTSVDGKAAPAAGVASVLGPALSTAAPLQATANVRFAGTYAVWLHVYRINDRAAPLKVELKAGDKVVAQGTINDGPGDAQRGGPTLFKRYFEEAYKNTPNAAALAKVLGHEKGGQEEDTGGDKADQALDALAEIASETSDNPAARFVNLHRVGKRTDPQAYWWRAFKVDLQPGAYQLCVTPAGADKAALDVAFLATLKDEIYPYLGDFDVPDAGSYLRFRIDKLPPGGLPPVNVHVQIHSEPFGCSFTLGENDLCQKSGTPKPFTKTGWTRWYRLQDAEYMPGGGGDIGFNLGIAKLAECAGVTQFAGYPHPDYVSHQFDWHEPDGLHLSMDISFPQNPHLLRTFRDHEREHYDWALAATKNQVFPLTRGGLTFTNSSGGCTGPSQEYMFKVLRLLGINVGASSDPLLARRLYGWDLLAGHYWPPAFMPFDEAKAKAQYDAYYRDQFSKQKETLQYARIFQIADEPGEINRHEMSAPLWVWEEDPKGGGCWTDLAGDGLLYSRRADFADCVLEGSFRMLPAGLVNQFGLRVAVDKPEAPTKYAAWQLGIFNRNTPKLNVITSSIDGQSSQSERPGATLAAGPEYRFKLVYERGQAALLLNDGLITTLKNLPAKGGFGIFGTKKSLLSLRVRPIARGEHIVPIGSGEADITGKDKADAIADDLDDDGPAAGDKVDKEKDLKTLIDTEWRMDGPMPQAHRAFRSWLEAQGVKPADLGKPSWDEVFILTLPEGIRTEPDRQRYLWSRRYSGWLTPHMFGLAAEGIHNNAPNKEMKNFVALSGHALYLGSVTMPLDMFQLAREGGSLMPGVSDWMSYGGWRFDSHESVAYSAAFYNAGGRTYGGGEPRSFPMMHCVYPATIRSYTMLANQVKHISYFWYGPSFVGTEAYWSEGQGHYPEVSQTCNRAALVDDLLAPGRMRPSRVALLYAHSTEYWNPAESYAEKRALFLGLMHSYYQPEVITEDQVLKEDALTYYDALYVAEPNVSTAVQARIRAWVEAGGLLWAEHNALSLNEVNLPQDLLLDTIGLDRDLPDLPDPKSVARRGRKTAKPKTDKPAPAKMLATGEAPGKLAPYTVSGVPVPVMECPGAKVLASYDTGTPAWLEKGLGKGAVVYIGHRAGRTYVERATIIGGWPTVWSDFGREVLEQPLLARHVERELVLSEPCVVASPLTTAAGTAVVLYSTRPYALPSVTLSLKEAKAPVAVQAFDGLKLVDVPFTFANGRVQAELKNLSGAQMVVFRRTPAPADDRVEALQAHAAALLAGADWRGISAGAWFAGLLPDAQLTPRLVPLLQHAEWGVRRSAAESLGRLKATAAGDALATAATMEKDAHAKGEMLLALARLGHPRTLDLARAGLADALPSVRAYAIRGMTELAAAAPDDAKLTAAVRELATQAVQDLDRRVYAPAATLLARLDPEATLARALKTAESAKPEPQAAVWLNAATAEPKVLDAWLAKGMPGNLALLLAFAGKQKQAKLAAAVTERLGDLKPGQEHALAGVCMTQADPALMRAVFAAREKLPGKTPSWLTFALESVFHGHAGNNLDAWATWLATHTTAP